MSIDASGTSVRLPKLIEDTQREVANTLAQIEHETIYNGEVAPHSKQLEYLLTQLYHSVFAALEERELDASVNALQQRWEKCEKAKGGIADTFIATDQFHDVRIDCPAQDVLNDYINALLVVLEKESTIREREQEREEAAKNHEREIRQESARHEISNRNFNAAMTIFTLVAGLTAGNCDKLQCQSKDSPSPRPAIFTGSIKGAEGLSRPANITIDCEPKIDGVLISANRDTYVLTVLPGTPTPLELFCSVRSRGFESEMTPIKIPRREERGRYISASLPGLTLEPSGEAH